MSYWMLLQRHTSRYLGFYSRRAYQVQIVRPPIDGDSVTDRSVMAHRYGPAKSAYVD
jgi:hypothetical protein